MENRNAQTGEGGLIMGKKIKEHKVGYCCEECSGVEQDKEQYRCCGNSEYHECLNSPKPKTEEPTLPRPKQKLIDPVEFERLANEINNSEPKDTCTCHCHKGSDFFGTKYTIKPKHGWSPEYCMACKRGEKCSHCSPLPVEGWEEQLTDCLEAIYLSGFTKDHKTGNRNIKKTKQFISKTLKAERERVHQAFVRNYRGAGEVWFPYESKGNCTKEEELEAVENEWQNVLDELKEAGDE